MPQIAIGQTASPPESPAWTGIALVYLVSLDVLVLGLASLRDMNAAEQANTVQKQPRCNQLRENQVDNTQQCITTAGMI